MEGARTWDRNDLKGHATLEDLIWADVDKIPQHEHLDVEDPNPTFDAERNPLQAGHSPGEIEASAAHLKRTLEDMVVTIFNAARDASSSSPNPENAPEPLKIRWVEAYFPFTSPSWELEVHWQGTWLEVLGCGIVQSSILQNANVPSRLGWAFGLGLERIAMLLYGIPDIRLFWSTDPRFLGQFKEGEKIRRFVPFSKYPAAIKDVSFWLPLPVSSSTAPSAAGGLGAATPSKENSTPDHGFHENDVMEIAREVCGDVVEDVQPVDAFTHPKTGRRSMCYRCNYRSLERTLTSEEANDLHEKLRNRLVERLGVELR